MFTARFFGWLSGGLAMLLLASAVANGLMLRDRDAKVKEIARLETVVSGHVSTIKALRKDVANVQKFDTADAEAAAQVCGSDVSAALARGITLGRSICVAQSQGALQ